MKTLVLPLKKKYFDQIKAGEKTVEYRLYNRHWIRRLHGKHFDKIVLTLGYPKKDDTERRIERPFRGYTVEKIKHPEWGNKPVTCFAIQL